jgi:hypothetical protein
MEYISSIKKICKNLITKIDTWLQDLVSFLKVGVIGKMLTKMV